MKRGISRSSKIIIFSGVGLLTIFLFSFIIPTTVSNEKRSTSGMLLSGLPVTEFYKAGKADSYVVLLTGDGGWKPLVRELSAYFNRKNISVAGLDSKKYFWEKKTPQQMAQDLTELISYYHDHWKKEKVMLVGYSFGADVLPFAINRLPANLRKQISNLVLIAPNRHAQFEIKLMDYLSAPQGGELVLPELQQIAASTVFTVCDDNEDALCLDMATSWDYVTLDGGHHFDGEYDQLNQLIGHKLGLE